MKAIVYKYWHTITIIAVSFWTVLGNQGQDGLINLAVNTIAKHPRWTALAIIASHILAKVTPYNGNGVKK